MRFLANENFPLASVRLLRDAGHEVRAVAEETPGARDADVLTTAAAGALIILTFDRDYGELIYRLGHPSPPGLVYFRFRPATPQEPAALLFETLKAPHIVLENHFTIVERGRIRQRPM